MSDPKGTPIIRTFHESVYEEVAALRKLVGLADEMFRQMRDDQQALSDAFYFMEFGHNGPSVAGALDGADRRYVYHRHEEGPKLYLPNAMEALGQGVRDVERRAALERKRDSYIARIRSHVDTGNGSDRGVQS